MLEPSHSEQINTKNDRQESNLKNGSTNKARIYMVICGEGSTKFLAGKQ